MCVPVHTLRKVFNFVIDIVVACLTDAVGFMISSLLLTFVVTGLNFCHGGSFFSSASVWKGTLTRGAPLRERAYLRVEAGVTLHAWKVFAAAQARTKREEAVLPTRAARGSHAKASLIFVVM